MGKTKLDRLSKSPETHLRLVNRAIRQAMARNEVRSMEALGDMIGLGKQQMIYRCKHGWDSYEIRRINQALRFTEAELVDVTGGLL